MFVVDTRYSTLCWWRIRDIGRYVGGEYEVKDVMMVVGTRYMTFCWW